MFSIAHVAWCVGRSQMLIIIMMIMILQRSLDQLPFSQTLLVPQKPSVPALGYSLRSFLEVPLCRSEPFTSHDVWVPPPHRGSVVTAGKTAHDSRA